MIQKKVKLTFTEPLLGTLAANEEVMSEFIAAKHPDGSESEEAQNEVAALPDVEEEIKKQSTVFPRNKEGQIFRYDYQMKGFFKEVCGMLRRVPGSAESAEKSPVRAYKKVIDGLVFVYPRECVIDLAGDIDWNERPLRASTAQGERICLARSEMAPAGSTMVLTIKVLNDKLMNFVDAWLDHGADFGLGQWRGGGMGRFTWEDVDD